MAFKSEMCFLQEMPFQPEMAFQPELREEGGVIKSEKWVKAIYG
jgi:hypothetical protein